MKITFIDFTGGNGVEVIDTDGAVTLTFDHLWDKSGREPELLASFDGEVWTTEDGAYTYTDIMIGENL